MAAEMTSPLCLRTVNVYSSSTGKQEGKIVELPAAFCSPIRADIINFVHSQVSRNSRQAYGVFMRAGYGTAAESWGTGRAVARIPRVPGGGTHRAGQGAFGNMCRGGSMFSPNPVWRRWHRKINQNLKRYAIVSALAATLSPALVMARGHKVLKVPEFPLVVSNDVQSITKTKEAMDCLKNLGLDQEIEKVARSKQINTGRGKSRNRRYRKRLGPLVIYADDQGITRAFRNIPGVDLCHVDRLNLLKLAPGGHVGRLCLWTEEAMHKLKEIYTAKDGVLAAKKGFKIPVSCMTNADCGMIVSSAEVQSAVLPQKIPRRINQEKRNPLKCRSLLATLCPSYIIRKSKTASLTPQQIKTERRARLIAKRKDPIRKAEKKQNNLDQLSFSEQRQAQLAEARAAQAANKLANM